MVLTREKGIYAHKGKGKSQRGIREKGKAGAIKGKRERALLVTSAYLNCRVYATMRPLHKGGTCRETSTRQEKACAKNKCVSMHVDATRANKG